MPSYLPLREATADDAARILELATISDIAQIGEPETTIGRLESGFASRGFHGAVVEDDTGALAGYVFVEHPPTHSLVWGDIIVRPGAESAVSALLLDWLLATAATLGPGLELHAFAYVGELTKRALYEAAGGEVIRHSYRMAIDVTETRFDTPSLRAGVAIRPVVGAADLRAMHDVVDVAFLDHFAHEAEPYDDWLQQSAKGAYSDLSLWWIATVDGEPAAGLYAGTFPASGYIDTLGTLRAYRGLGLARALLLTAFAEFRRRGMRKVTLTVDATNPTGALQLYESAGMHIEHKGVRYRLPIPQPAG